MKIKVTIQSDLNSREIEVDGVFYSLWHEDQETKQTGFMPGFRGEIDPTVIGNSLALMRNHVIHALGVKPEEEDNFDNTIREVGKLLRQDQLN